MFRLYFASVALIGFLLTGCTATPALHVVGVYQGEEPTGLNESSWWAKCNYRTSNITSASDEPLSEEDQYYDYIHTEKEVIVYLADERQPTILSLSAYDRTHWKVCVKGKAKIKKVILAGYHKQRVSGLHKDTPIEVYTYYRSPCKGCTHNIYRKHFHSYKNPSSQLKEITGLEPKSFQGRYIGSEFYIFPGIEDF